LISADSNEVDSSWKGAILKGEINLVSLQIDVMTFKINANKLIWF
jgi:hypothetical protein